MDTGNEETFCENENLLDTKFLNSLIRGARNIFLLWLISQKKKYMVTE